LWSGVATLEIWNGTVILEVIVLIKILYEFIINKFLYPLIFFKILLITSFMTLYFWLEQSLFKLSLYSIGGSGGWLRNEIYNDVHYVFQWYEVLFWNFIFSLHYPVYIYLFFKPFVNHLDKSIRKIQKEKEE